LVNETIIMYKEMVEGADSRASDGTSEKCSMELRLRVSDR
jgi:hypothetical protein